MQNDRGLLLSNVFHIRHKMPLVELDLKFFFSAHAFIYSSEMVKRRMSGKIKFWTSATLWHDRVFGELPMQGGMDNAEIESVK